MRRNILLLLALVFLIPIARGQGLVGDLLAGKLVNPKAGQWAWYNLTDARGGKKYVIRQAIVGEEKINRKQGYWVEFEVIPEVGFKMVYKMLLTGPANDPKNIHRVIEKSGVDPAREIAIDGTTPANTTPESKRRSLGLDEVSTMNGVIRAEHYEVTQGDQVIGVWINEKINPTGIVRMRSLDGEMVLRNHGTGGENAKSIITETPLPPDEPAPSAGPKPEIKAETKPNEAAAEEKAEEQQGATP
ncbi:MAG: hypothetical protein HUU46_15395 [Candidatus Hydrogenedentes bacterium]|nr:hypothetical protein [Candidatus Hydrogenedentota bacterium]